MDNLLNNLYKEYSTLYERLKGVGDLIIVYGGKIPSIPAHRHSEVILEAAMEDFISYPSNGTWGEKILFVLKEVGKPSTVGTLSEIVKKYQQQTDIGKIVNSLTQACSTMAAKGEIEVKKGYRNKYSLKEKPL